MKLSITGYSSVFYLVPNKRFLGLVLTEAVNPTISEWWITMKGLTDEVSDQDRKQFFQDFSKIMADTFENMANDVQRGNIFVQLPIVIYK